MGNSFACSWLHLTDLHFGQPEHSRLWPNIAEELDREFARRHSESGPWDFILLTGDLSYSGTAEEFAQLDRWLDGLLANLSKLGSRPAVFAVPGNHDLMFQDSKDPRIGMLKKWHTDRDISADFFGPNKYAYRTVIEGAFAEYSKWWEHRCAPSLQRLNLRRGLCPGDFAVTFEKAGFCLGLVGLNSAFLQLVRGINSGGIALDVRQFLHLCDGEPSQWAKPLHAALLLTHHPPSWLPQTGIGSHAEFETEIYKAHRFLAHFCGHLHLPEGRYCGYLGSPLRRTLQGRALSAMDPHSESPHEAVRNHGFTVCQLQIESGSTEASLRLWPRFLQMTQPMQFIPDSHAFALTNDRYTEVKVDLRRAYEPVSAVSITPLSESRRPALSMPALRSFVQALVQHDTVFMEFCRDYFHETWQVFGQDQKHGEKLTLLLARHTAEDIYWALLRAFPERAKQHLQLL